MTDLDRMFDVNSASWDERVAVHLAPGGVDLSALRAGRGRLDAIEERELPELIGPLEGKRIVHLQCPFGADSLALAQRGARARASRVARARRGRLADVPVAAQWRGPPLPLARPPLLPLAFTILAQRPEGPP